MKVKVEIKANSYQLAKAFWELAPSDRVRFLGALIDERPRDEPFLRYHWRQLAKTAAGMVDGPRVRVAIGELASLLAEEVQ